MLWKLLDFSSETHYFKLPYIGRMSKHVNSTINKLVLNLCRDLNVKLVFTTCNFCSFAHSSAPRIRSQMFTKRVLFTNSLAQAVMLVTLAKHLATSQHA